MENGYQSMSKLISEVEDLKASLATNSQSTDLFDKMKGLDLSSEGVSQITKIIEQIAKNINTRVTLLDTQVTKIVEAKKRKLGTQGPNQS